jgi:acyl-CoA synthetase (NDP forming)
MKPFIVLWFGGSFVHDGMRIIEESGIPLLRSEDICVKALRCLRDYELFQENNQKNQGSMLSDFNGFQANFSESIPKDLRSSKEIFSKIGIPFAKEELVSSPEEALVSARRIGYPIAMKVISPQISHKTEMKAVILNIRNDEELLSSYEKILKNATSNGNIEIKGILVQEMVMGGVEVLLGMYRDPEIGPILTFGMGGIFVELMKDIAIRIPPLTTIMAEKLIQDIKGYDILMGFRGGGKVDIEALNKAITNFSRICPSLSPEITELEINPLMVLEEKRGVKIIDCRMHTN